MQVVPEIYAQVVIEKMGSKALVKNMATDLGVIISGEKGDTISFPRSKRIGDATEVVKGTAKTPAELDFDEVKAVIKQMEAPPVRIYDKTQKEALGYEIQNAAKQQSDSLDYKFDLDLIEEMDTTDLKVHAANAKAITSNEIDEALLLFGDDRNVEDFTNGGIIIHSALITSFTNMVGFTSASNTTVTALNGIARKNCLGFYQGIPVIFTNHGTEKNGEYRSFILKNDAIGYKIRQGLTVEDFRPEGLYATDLYSSMMYAVKLIEEESCVSIKNSNPAA
ncbi:hypothetical protein Ccar_16185 [Clostridium carboxidivorans P7]|uniref:Phage major capsid protein n=1 Tax=Clostridium carboxidivorans P7 TaxID=536227 RepID=C6Q140_9CLOT|nr:hypothetical protein [Clostridium carboxidivorans]AKN32317.1 hypothetical protein Ccar_16185 [Clostridium carboxidivorans P7]EET84776.1 conserved hypothetical protein [Clostridium carboxidivorans P7]